MNYFDEIKEDILINRNTAQSSLETILENTNKNITELLIKENLEGDIDFSILKTMNFGLVNSIILKNGSATSIKNIPETVKYINIESNLIDTLEDLPKDLETLHIQNNYLKEIDISYLTKLEKLYLDSNRLEKLEKIPPNLTELSVCYNKLNEINLEGVDKLQILNVSENPISIIENLPEKIVEFTHENTPSIEFRYVSHLDNVLEGTTEDEIKNEKEMQKNYKESLLAYFELKSKYEKKLFELKKKAHAKENTKKRKRMAAKSVIAPCVKCKKKVGTLFYKKENIYYAKCGDPNSPCNLDIRLHDGITDLIEENLKDIHTEINETKENIIKHKLDTLFNYIDEKDAAELYKTYLEDFNLDNNVLTMYLGKRSQVFHSEVKEKAINEKNEKLYSYVQDIQRLLKDYKESNNEEILKQAISIHINDIIPEMRNLRNIQYEVMEMEIDPIKKTNKLVQFPILFSKLEDSFETQRVEKFIV